jgi:GT2 family glycosyltransferase
MDISVVIPTLKPRDEILAVEYLERGTFDDYEVVVSDEAPVTRARNDGVERAEADKIVFLDDDSQPEPNYLERASETLEREDAVAGKIVHPHDDIFRRRLTPHYSHGDEPTYVDHFWGCNMALRREALEAVGGWDENMGWGHEEKELADRVREEYDIYYDPEMLVEHPYADSLFDYWEKRYKLERQTPYYWNKRDVPFSRQLGRTLFDFVNPKNYLGYTPKHALARSGTAVARTAGRLRGFVAEARSGDAPADEPVASRADGGRG